MSPPTEQLIRDYLNRLSVAARDRLSPEDRRALVTRAHDFIDRNASPSGPPTSTAAAALLSRLGDPAALVDQEVTRLAALRGEAAVTATQRQPRTPRRLRRLSGYSSWHWPAAPGSEDLRIRLLNGDSEGPGAHTDEDAAAGQASSASPPVWIPVQHRPADGARPAWPSAAALGANGRELAEPVPAGKGGVPGTASGSDNGRGGPGALEASSGGAIAVAPDQEPDRAPQWTPRNPLWTVLTARGSALASRIFTRARRNPVAAAAVTLLGIGGAAYPPIWLLGAALALASHAWDYRDKWIGLAIPVLLLVVGTAFGVTLGVRYTTFGGYVHEGWVYADILSRVGAAAGAGYLVWRLRHARRVPTVPPWNKPHRVD